MFIWSSCRASRQGNRGSSLRRCLYNMASIVVLVSLCLANLAPAYAQSLSRSSVESIGAVAPGAYDWRSDYQPLVFERPEPIRGVRPEVGEEALELKREDMFLERQSELTLDAPLPQYQMVSCPTTGDLVLASGETCSLNAGAYTFDSVEVISKFD